ncbi:MAG TPA: excalibur calcium-binding domain-containing protein [Microlunatus sp.]|nr:excalibur calcium-binding domain-containing protein [Microlunatus sp.]
MLEPRRAIAGATAALVTAGLSLGIGAIAPAGSLAAPAPAAAAAKKYKNCTALHKAYSHGVKKSSSTKDVVRSKGKTTKKSSKAKTSKALYNANKKLDRDKDGIACER